jgi:hypothetical protein
MGNSELFQTAMSSGRMGQATVAGLSRRQMRRRTRAVTGQKAEGWERFTDIMATPYDVVSGFSEMIELVPRMGEFRLAIRAKGEEQGIWKRLARDVRGKNDGTLATASTDTILTAGLAGRELTLDFQQGGDLVLAANKGVPFLNAKFLGFSRMWDTFKERPVHAVTAAMVLPLVTVLPSRSRTSMRPSSPTRSRRSSTATSSRTRRRSGGRCRACWARAPMGSRTRSTAPWGR